MTDTVDRLEALPPDYAETREAMRRLAVYVLSPARRAVTGRIGLQPAPGGFATPAFGDGEQLRVEGATLHRQADGRGGSVPITTLAAAADFAGVKLSDDPGVGHDIPELGDPDAPLPVSPAAALALGAFYVFSGAVLAEFKAELDSAGQECSAVQLWPEHFDLGCNVEGVNFGCSPGDGYSDEPYIYVGPWNTDGLGGDFWNASFGAVLSYAELLTAGDQRETVLAFLRRGVGLALSRAGEVP
ncbi:MAG TPA: hypothetical protein VGO87_13000 [Acidimicrobiia bacterium]